jgi:hypothetical protein
MNDEEIVKEMIRRGEEKSGEELEENTKQAFFKILVAVRKQVRGEFIDEEVKEIDKFLERLRGYGCGYHKHLEKQMLNHKKRLERIKKYGK